MNPKTLLVDCDGVLLDWSRTFQQWMAARGLVQRAGAQGYYRVQDQFGVADGEAKKYTQLFNESAAIGFLEPFRDAVPWVQKINSELGYRFVVITSLSQDPFAVKLREQNLRHHFGDVFDRVWCLDTGSDKDHALEQYKNTGLFWCEDKPENALAGLGCGLRPILMEHDHNRDCDHAAVLRVRTWQEIYHVVASQTS